ncbi:hypothetical protein [Methyloceanibacter sp.]|uniref:hypothetical protein n=1 Tax=Methyloceanibacter sp. TaxID=1965321 RepID=UPI003D6CE1DF
MTKNAPAHPDAMLALQTVADASNEAGLTCPTPEGTIFDDLSLIGALLFGEAISETLIEEVEPDRRH